MQENPVRDGTRARLVQVINVGDVMGGTAACAWSVVRALPEMRHHVLCRSPVTALTTREFAPVVVDSVRDGEVRRRLVELKPDLILFHNTPPLNGGVIAGTRWPAPSIQYAHSLTRLGPADVRVACSRWLARQFAEREPSRPLMDVLWQGVPGPGGPEGDPRAERRSLGSQSLVVGRLCTPKPHKFPETILPFYAALAKRCPFAEWEFVGVPPEREPALKEACGGRAAFHAANWQARDRLLDWDVCLYHHPGLTESFGRVTAESMLAGCIPLVDARGGFLEQLDQFPFLVCKTLDEFARQLQALAALPTVRRALLQKELQRTATDRFSLPAFGQRLRSWTVRCGWKEC